MKVAGQPRLGMMAFQVFDGFLVIIATASSDTLGVPKMGRVTQPINKPKTLT